MPESGLTLRCGPEQPAANCTLSHSFDKLRGELEGVVRARRVKGDREAEREKGERDPLSLVAAAVLFSGVLTFA